MIECDALLIALPVRFEATLLPYRMTLRKYVCVVFGVAQLLSDPGKRNVSALTYNGEGHNYLRKKSC